MIRFILLSFLAFSLPAFAQTLSIPQLNSIKNLDSVRLVATQDLAVSNNEEQKSEIRLCVEACLAEYDRPSSELKACVAKCQKKGQ